MSPSPIRHQPLYPAMDVEAIRCRLQNISLDFWSAISSPSTLYTFNTEWLALREDVQKALHLSLLDEDDISLAHSVASQIAIWGDLLLRTNDEATKLTSSFMDEMESIFERFSISDIPAVQHVSPRPFSHVLHSNSAADAAPSYIAAAYSWTLQNIHDPYPSSETKEHICRHAGRPFRVITDWFKQMRRHIGWVSMCKTHFKGSRALAVQAAKHVYLHNPTSLQPSSDLVSQLESIRTRLQYMYPLNADNGDLSDSTDDSFIPLPLASRRSPSSRSSSSTPSLVFSSDDEDNHSLVSFVPDDAPTSLGKRKKFTEDEPRTLKRNRFGCISAVDGLVPDIVDVASATSATASPGVASNVSAPPPPPVPSRKRRLSVAATEWEDSTTNPKSDPRPPLRVPKRRLSVSDSQPTPKRPCLPPTVGPRKQAVSTPIPVAHQSMPDIDDWFRTFELPDTSLSVELFSNWDVTVESDVFPYDSLYDDSVQPDSPDFLNETPSSDAYQLSTPLDLGVSSAIDPSILDISSVFTESPASSSTLPEPITATASSAFDLLDAFLFTVNAESAEPQSPQSSLSPYAGLSLDDTIDIFGDLVD